MAAELNEAIAPYDRGLVLAGEERYNEAIEHFRKAHDCWQKDHSTDQKLALVHWADALREQEQYEEAAKKCEEALSLDPEDPETYLQLGRVLADQERFAKAIEQYRQADELWQKERSQERKRTLYYWAELLSQQEQYEKAAKKCQAAIAIDPDYPEAHQGLGWARAKQGRFSEAIEQYRQADERWRKKESRKRKFVLCNWADALLWQEQHEEAAKKCEEALRLDPECADACRQLGRVLKDQGRFAEAIKQYRQADERWRKKESRKRK
jgi:tetratricopeptide (TPR) repeat protein